MLGIHLWIGTHRARQKWQREPSGWKSARHALNHSGRKPKNRVALTQLSQNPPSACSWGFPVYTALCLSFSGATLLGTSSSQILEGATSTDRWRAGPPLETQRRAANAREEAALPSPCSPSTLLTGKEAIPRVPPLTLTHRGHPTGHITRRSNPDAPGTAFPPSWESSPPFQALLIDVPNA